MHHHAENSQSVIAGKYAVIDCLSRSPRATILRCSSLAEGSSEVVAKIFNIVAMTSEEICRMEMEIATVCRVAHPYLIEGIEEINAQGLRGYIMEYAEGGSLAERVSVGSMSIESIVELAAQLCSALNAIHSCGIVHRDIRPSNILFDKNGVAKIANFGIIRSDNSNRLTDYQSILGAADYVSPEYLASGMLDRRSDIYALGTVLYQLVCGATPFSAENPMDGLMARLHTDPTSPRSHNASCPAALEGILLRALQRNPFCRYESGSEMLSDLLLFSPSLKIAASPCPIEAIYLTPLFTEADALEEVEDEMEDCNATLARIEEISQAVMASTFSLGNRVIEVCTSEEAKQFGRTSISGAIHATRWGTQKLHRGAVQGYRFVRTDHVGTTPRKGMEAILTTLLFIVVSMLGYRYAGPLAKVELRVPTAVVQVVESLTDTTAAHAKEPGVAETIESKKRPEQKELRLPSVPKVITR